MARKRTLSKKLLSFFLMIAVTVTMIPGGLILSADTAHAAGSVTMKGKQIGTSDSAMCTHYFWATDGSGYVGLCCQYGTDAREKATTYQLVGVNDTIRNLAYWYGYKKGWSSGNKGVKLARCFHYVRTGKVAKWFTKAEFEEMIRTANANPAPAGFVCYKADHSSKQDAVVWKMENPGYARLIKQSTDSKSTLPGSGCTMAGIEYTVTNNDTGAYVGTLTCDASGNTGWLTVTPGSYKIVESKTNGSYKLNNSPLYATVASGEWKTVYASDSVNYGKINIEKSVTPESYDGSLEFTFRLTNTANSGISYTVKTNAQTGKASVDVIPGTYRCEELLGDDSDFEDATGVQEGTVAAGGTFTFTRENKYHREHTLQVTKTLKDDSTGTLEGFNFRVTGVLYNQGVMTAEALLNAAAPEVTYDADSFELGDWTVDETDLAALNTAAKNRENGTKTVKITNKITYKGETGKSAEDIAKDATGEKSTISAGTLITDGSKTYRAKEDVEYDVAYKESASGSEGEGNEGGEGGDAGSGDGNGDDPAEPAADEPTQELDVDATAANIRALLSGDAFEEVDTEDKDLEATVTVNLKNVEYVYNSENPGESGYEKNLGNQIKNPVEKTAGDVKYNDFDWYGAATIYKEIVNGEFTGKDYKDLVTYDTGKTDLVQEGIDAGKFTVTEVLTEEQAKRYKQPAAQTQELQPTGNPLHFNFTFENVPKVTPVELAKTCVDGNITGINFRLQGTNVFGEEIDLSGTTDSDGKIDFGKLFAGEYVISETDFDIKAYKNTYKLEGYDVPAQRITITGEEEEPVTVTFKNVPQTKLYLTKVDKDSQVFLPGATFNLFKGEAKIASFRIVMDDYGAAGVELLWTDEDSGIYANTPVVTPPPEDEDETHVGGDDQAAGSDNQIGTENDESGTTGGDNEGTGDDTSSDTPAEVTYNYACIMGLEEGDDYRIVETFAPKGYSASVDFSFTFEDGAKYVMENESPEIGTTAKDKDTELHMSNAEGTVTIVDTVAYKGLAPGHEYIMTGNLVYKPAENDGDSTEIETVKDKNGKEVTAEKKFTPESSEGTIDMEFTFDASALDGKTTVAFEYLKDPSLMPEYQTVAIHADPEDPAQTIYFPKVETTATGDDTGIGMTNAGQTTITDKVDYSNVEAGKVYTITGTLMDKESGKPITSGGSAVTAEKTFKATADGPVFAEDSQSLTPDEPVFDKDGNEVVTLVSGTVELKFTLDASALAGTKAVAFEKLTCEGKVVGEHTDINDDDQTVNIPQIGTKASTNGKDTVTDKVAYKNLRVGQTYIMKGILMNKKTGEPVTDENGDEITSELKFTPTTENGIVKLSFDIDAKKLRGKSVVAFETCYLVKTATGTDQQGGDQTAQSGSSEVQVAQHADINSKAQTVSFKTPQTGQSMPWLIGAAIAALLAAAGYLLRRRFTGNI